MLGLPTKELKQVAVSAELTIKRVNVTLDKADAVLVNLIAISSDLRAITGMLRQALVKE